MPEETPTSSRSHITTAIISAVSTIIVAIIAAYPVLKNKNNENDNLAARVDSLTQLITREQAATHLATFTIRGTITNKTGNQPLTDAEIYLFPADMTSMIPTDAGGKFIFPHVQNRPYYILVRDITSEKGSRGLMETDNKHGQIPLDLAVVNYDIEDN